ncbi:MAG: oxidoreductase [Jiangellaceae bacterium]
MDPFAGVAALTGVGAAAAHARDAVDALLSHPAMRRDAARLAAESALRGARASASLAGGDVDDVDDPILQGALRATAEVAALAGVWDRSPGQVLARLHVLAARDLAELSTLGRPRPGTDGVRLDQLMRLAAGSSSAPAVVVAAVVHAELMALEPFGVADGVVARAAERVVLVARGVDTRAVSIPEAGHLELVRAYEPLALAYASGTADGVAAWVRHCCEAYARGVDVALAHASGAPG